MNEMELLEKRLSRLQTHLSLIRTCAGWSAAVLGEKLGVSRQMISSLENGRNKMTITQYRAIRHAIMEEIERSPEDTQMLSDVIHVLVDEPEKYTDEQRNTVLSDANLLAPSIVAKKTSRKNASVKWVTALAGAVVAAVAIGITTILKEREIEKGGE